MTVIGTLIQGRSIKVCTKGGAIKGGLKGRQTAICEGFYGEKNEILFNIFVKNPSPGVEILSMIIQCDWCYVRSINCVYLCSVGPCFC